ncbi:MAG: SPOR domain-containing protein [Ignavibacteriae bacterium]|nr:SPOR domain-containing protein [Ignavibacteriota bacterium]
MLFLLDVNTLMTYRPDRVGIFFAFALLCGSVSFSHAQGIRLISNAGDSLVAKPGSVVTAAVTITNRTARKQTYDPKLLLPAGWRAVTRESAFELQPNASDVRLLTFAVSSEVPAGRYEIRYTVSDRAKPRNESTVTLRVGVQAVRKIEIQLVDKPRFIVAGSTYRVEFLLTNKGNAPAVALLSAQSVLDFPMKLDIERVELAPRSSRSVVVTVTTPSGIITKTLHNFELSARFADEQQASTKAVSLVEIIPNVTAVEDQYHELPVYVSLRGVGMESDLRAQVQVGGSGSFSEKGDDRIDFLFRGPSTQQYSILGQQDEYRIHYSRSGLELYAGDGNFALTPLTELGRYATGAGGKVSVGDFAFQGYYNETRWYSPSQKQYGGGVSYAVTESEQVGVQYLKKLEAAVGGVNSDIATVRGLVDRWQFARVDAEYAMGKAQGKRGDAYALRLNGGERWLHYDVRYVHADPLYSGYYRDVNFASANFSLSLFGGVRLEAYARSEERNLRRDTTAFTAPQDQYFQIGTGYSSFVSVYYRRVQQKDLMPSSQYQRVEDVAQIQLGYNLMGVDVYANADFGRTYDRLQNKQAPSKRFALFSTIRPTTGQSYNASLEYTDDQNLLTGDKQKRYSIGLQAWFSLGESTTAQLGGYTSRTTGSFEQTYNSLEFVLEHKFPFNHKIAVRGKQNDFTPTFGIRERAYAVEYLIPINIPVKRLTTSGSVSGKVVDAVGRGMGNVLVNIGTEAAVTDRNGNFFFAAVPPEKQYLIVDRATIGLDKLTLQPMPMELVVRGGEEERVDINVVQSASLTGTVTVYNFAEENPLDTARQQLVDAGGYQGIIVEISNGSESHRRISDNLGRFTFTDVRPGRWTMSVVAGQLPQYHFVERQSYDVALQPGLSSTADIRILPRRRTIQILSEGVVLKPSGAIPAPIITPEPPVMNTGGLCLIHYRKPLKGWLLQVSSWRTRSKAEQQASITERFAGVPAFVQRVTLSETGVWYRVYAGPLPSRKDAEDLCTRLKIVQ